MNSRAMVAIGLSAAAALTPGALVASGCVLPGFTNVERQPDGGGGDSAAAAGSVGSGGAPGAGGDGGSGAGRTDAGASIDAGPGVCPPVKPGGDCSGYLMCVYAPEFCECEFGYWYCTICPDSKPGEGVTCSIQGMSCDYGTAPQVVSCQCTAPTAVWACGVN